jgi:hypothetical protein
MMANRSAGLQNILQDAVANGNLQFVKFLIEENGMNVKRKYSEGYLLHTSLWSDNIDMVKYLVKIGADTNKKDEQGRTALQFEKEMMMSNPNPTSNDKKMLYYLASVTVQKQAKTKTARTKARAKLNTKVQQHTRRRFGDDVSSVIASFIFGEPKIKHTFAAHKKINTRLRESAVKNGVKLTTQVAGKRKHKSDSTLRVQIANVRKNKSN